MRKLWVLTICAFAFFCVLTFLGALALHWLPWFEKILHWGMLISAWAAGVVGLLLVSRAVVQNLKYKRVRGVPTSPATSFLALMAIWAVTLVVLLICSLVGSWIVSGAGYEEIIGANGKTYFSYYEVKGAVPCSYYEQNTPLTMKLVSQECDFIK